MLLSGEIIHELKHIYKLSIILLFDTAISTWALDHSMVLRLNLLIIFDHVIRQFVMELRDLLRGCFILVCVETDDISYFE